MKILLVYPRCKEQRITNQDDTVVPMGLFSIGAVLMDHGHDVVLINEYGLDPGVSIARILEREKPDLVGLSVFNANRSGAQAWAQRIREELPDCLIVFGGVAATFLWEYFLTYCQAVDCIVVGEGEYTFLELVHALSEKAESDFDAISGLAWRKQGKPVLNPARPFIANLDELPCPAKYFTYDHVSFSRGCPGNCTFCGSPKFWQRKVRFHSAGYFVDELEMLYRKGVRFFYISDDTFTMKKTLVLEVCKEILSRKLVIDWYAISRVDCVDEDIMYWMRKAGCIQISFGVESGSEKIRTLLNKKITTDQIIRAFDLTQSYGILARAYFIYACPGETWETIDEHIRLIRRIKPLSAIFYILHLFPGTALYEKWKEEHGFSDDIWKEDMEDVLYFESDPTMSRDLVLAFGKKLRTTFYEDLSEYARSLTLKDVPDLAPAFADFYSRLAMTFSHGDYAAIEAITDKDITARMLYERSLSYGPSIRAYLGLGMLAQKKRDMQAAFEILDKGLRLFPDDADLHQCMGITLMNCGRFKDALLHFIPFEDSKQSLSFAATCYQALGDHEQAENYQKKMTLLD
ncbi:MAG: radical SAM protein [Desulfoplanes sp.]|jgi:radical SAM superfamily enzyme YgiQ (UPF0313 family)|nr:radical SAM protein [Desulfoplanes sp.]